MHFENRTDYQADALWGEHQKDGCGAAVIVKGTFEIAADGLKQVQEDAWPVHFRPLETPYGDFPPEHNPFPKSRTDLIVCGFARPPRGTAVSQMDVRLSIRDFAYVLRVFGDRVWKRDGRKLVPSEPESFERIPLTLASAFGGSVETEWGTMSYGFNPYGKGFGLEPDEAEGTALPNLEDPRHLIRTVTDRPAPVAPCACADAAGLRLPPAQNPLGPERAVPIGESLHNWAHPDLMLPAWFDAGELVRVEGVHPDGPLQFAIPTCRAAASAAQGPDRYPMRLKLDTIIVLGEERRAVFRWRGATTFPIRPREQRLVRLDAIGQEE